MLCFVDGMRGTTINFKGRIRDETTILGSGVCSVL